MSYFEALIIATEEGAEQLVEQLQPFAEGQSVAQEQLGDPNDLNPNAMLPGMAIKFWYQESLDSVAWRNQINQISQGMGFEPAQFTLLESIDWTTEWKKNYRPIIAGERFVILPPWEDNPDPKRTPILIDPGVAFGTGQHETTRLCISQLERHVQPSMSLLDLGAGSAILSMAGHHLGASPITAVEIDPDAIRSGQENLKLNNLQNKITFLEGSLEVIPEQQWDLVVANILAVILIRLIQEDGLLEVVRPRGRIIFSGIIDQQEQEFLAAIDQSNFGVESITAEGEWIAVTVRRLQV